MPPSADLVLDPSIALPDGFPSVGPFRTSGFGYLSNRFRIDADGHLVEEACALDGTPSGIQPRRVPLHGLLPFEGVGDDQRRYTARFTYGRLDGIKLGEERAWDEAHGA